MKPNKAPIIFFAVLAVLLLGYFIYTNSDGNQFSWHESYDTNSDQPYGTLFIRKMLASYREDGKLKVNEKYALKQILNTDSTASGTDYVLIGQSLFLDSIDIKLLSDYIYAGNDAFISTMNPPIDLINKVHYSNCESYFYYDSKVADSIRANFYHDSLRSANDFTFINRYGADDRPYYWSHVGTGVLCDKNEDLTPLGYQDTSDVNFIRISYGQGNLYLHSNPIFFTNYFLTDKEKLPYYSSVFSHLHGKNILWDEYSKVPFFGNQNPYSSPLYYILSQKSLKYAWWMFLGTIVLYVFFAAKRTQRVIPVLEPKTNTSLEYINLISTLHYRNGNHLDMAKKKMKYFLYFIRSKYGVHAQTLKEEHLVNLSKKSQVNLDDIKSIFSQYSFIEQNRYENIEANRFLNLFYAIENFYKHCK